MINSVVHAGTRMLESGQSIQQVHAHRHSLLDPFVAGSLRCGAPLTDGMKCAGREAALQRKVASRRRPFPRQDALAPNCLVSQTVRSAGP